MDWEEEYESESDNDTAMGGIPLTDGSSPECGAEDMSATRITKATATSLPSQLKARTQEQNPLLHQRKARTGFPQDVHKVSGFTAAANAMQCWMF
jgi:hypothetical protein